MTNSTSTDAIKWPEILSLAGLSVAIAISWIAYHEYQPQLLKKFGFNELAVFLIIAKGIVLVIIPPIAGWLADLLIKKSGKFFMIFSVGIGATAMIFMVVATLIGIESLYQIKSFLPIMIVLWLVGMNVFVSPAISMIDSFAPKDKLPLVVGVLFLVTELVYALEPLVVELVVFFGDTLTFIVGGVLIAGTGYLFQRISSDEVSARRTEITSSTKSTSLNNYLVICLVGIILGIGKAGLVEYIPVAVELKFASITAYGGYISFGLLGLSAIVAFFAGNYVAKKSVKKVILFSSILLLAATTLIAFSTSFSLFLAAGVLLAISFSFLNVSGLPFTIENLSARHITYGVGMFLGASEIASGFIEYVYQ